MISIRLLMHVILIVYLFGGLQAASAQDGIRISPTPVQAKLPEAPVQQSQQQVVAATNTPIPTSTDDPSVKLEVKADLGTADVRGLPDPEGEALEPIKTGTLYRVTGRFYKWIQFEYDKSLTNRGWVFEDLVNITGSNPIPEIDPYSTPSPTPLGGNIEATRAAVTLTPGGIETLDAQARIITMPTLETTGTVENTGPLPTFTLPAEVAAREAPITRADEEINTLEDTLVRAATGRIPPIVPILVLAAAGLLGMLISLLRR